VTMWIEFIWLGT